jgi:hypothetical protein
MIVVAIIALLAAITIPNILAEKCKQDCARGNCSEYCVKRLKDLKSNDEINTESVLKWYDRKDVEVFCKMYGVSVEDFARSKSLQSYYTKFKNGELQVVREKEK